MYATLSSAYTAHAVHALAPLDPVTYLPTIEAEDLAVALEKLAAHVRAGGLLPSLDGTDAERLESMGE